MHGSNYAVSGGGWQVHDCQGMSVNVRVAILVLGYLAGYTIALAAVSCTYQRIGLHVTNVADAEQHAVPLQPTIRTCDRSFRQFTCNER